MMFAGCQSFKLNLSKWKLHPDVNMECMFYKCDSLIPKQDKYMSKKYELITQRMFKRK